MGRLLSGLTVSALLAGCVASAPAGVRDARHSGYRS